MSIQSARDFLTKVAKDEKFRNGLSGCSTQGELHQYAHGAGFDFTSDEIRAARSELQDVDLEGISGGQCLFESTCPQDAWTL